MIDTKILTMMNNLHIMQQYQLDNEFNRNLSDSANHYLIDDIKELKGQLYVMLNADAVERDRIANVKGNDNLELEL